MSKPLVLDWPTVDTETESGESTGLRGPRIRCPLCEWMPSKGELWSCECGTAWHTFDTGGVCPACMHQWSSTQCHKCAGWSAHSDWYEY